MTFERIKNWEKCSVSRILVDLIDFNVLSTMDISPHGCESGIWISITLIKDGERSNVGGSRLDVVKGKLITWIDRRQIRSFLLNDDKMGPQMAENP